MSCKQAGCYSSCCTSWSRLNDQLNNAVDKSLLNLTFPLHLTRSEMSMTQCRSDMTFLRVGRSRSWEHCSIYHCEASLWAYQDSLHNCLENVWNLIFYIPTGVCVLNYEKVLQKLVFQWELCALLCSCSIMLNNMFRDFLGSCSSF